jgi:hypothetical protein
MTESVRAISVAGLVGFALVVCARAEDLAHSNRRDESSQVVGSTPINIPYPVLTVNVQAEWNELLGVGKTWGTTASETTSTSFDKDVRVNGNWLPAGVDEISLHMAAENGLHLALGWPPSSERDATETTDREVLRLALRAASAPHVIALRITLETDADDDRRSVEKKEDERDKEEESGDEEEDEEREEENEKEDSARLSFHWGARKAAVRLEMTGMRRRTTPPPDIPEHIREPWAVVFTSVEALIAEDLEKQNFADDFESDFDDGGSAAAHVQLLGHLKRGGILEGLTMSLEDLKWTADERTVEFRNIEIYSQWESSSFRINSRRPTLAGKRSIWERSNGCVACNDLSNRLSSDVGKSKIAAAMAEG